MSGTDDKKARKAKRDQFSEIYNEYYPLVCNTVYTRVGNWDDASDICQEIFLIFFQKFEEVENYRKWLFGTMRNVVLKHYRSKSKTEVDIEDFFDDIAMTFVNGMRDTRLLISEAIENIGMKEEERILFEYIAYDNYTYSNVGDILGLSKKQVFLRYNRIVENILRYLGGKGIHNIEDLL